MFSITIAISKKDPMRVLRISDTQQELLRMISEDLSSWLTAEDAGGSIASIGRLAKPWESDVGPENFPPAKNDSIETNKCG